MAGHLAWLAVLFVLYYRNVPKFSDKTGLIRVYTVYHFVCIFWTLYSLVERHCSNFRIVAAIFRVSEFLAHLSQRLTR